MLYLNNKFFAFILVIVLTASCTTTYVYHSDLPHLKIKHSVVVSKKGECEIIDTYYSDKTVVSSDKYNWNDCGTLDLDSESDSCMYFLEGKDVIYFHGSYWIKDGKDLGTLQDYVNQDINFN